MIFSFLHFLLSVLRFFLEYQWLVDFAVYTTGIFLFTECYYCVVDATKEVNIGAIWCVLTVLFCLYPPFEKSFWCYRVLATAFTARESLLHRFFPLNPAALRKTLHTLMSHYFRSEEGGERSVCLAFGFLSLLVAMLVLVVREDYLEFGLESGFSSLFDNLEIFVKQQGYADWS